MLVHHAYAEAVCHVWIGNPDIPAPDPNGTTVGVIEAEKNAHKSRLACSVLSEKGVYLPGADLKGNVIVCHYSGKLLADVQHFYNVFHG